MNSLFKFLTNIGLGYFRETTIYATALQVLDGDTFFCRNIKNSEVLKIRLANIDAPEIQQAPHGLISKNFLSNLITKNKSFKRVMRIELIKPSSHKSFLAKVYLMENKTGGSEVYLQRILLRMGMAFSHEERTDDPFQTTRDQIYAMDKRNGMWKWNKKDRPMEPWIWRRQNGIDIQEETPSQYIDRLKYEQEHRMKNRIEYQI